MYHLSHPNLGSGRSRSNSSTTTSLPPSNSRGWIPYMLKKSVVHQDLRMEEERLSIMFSVLPTSIQSRLPPIPSLRKTVTRPIRAAPMEIGTATTPPAQLMSPFSSGRTTPVSEAETAVMDVSESEADTDSTRGFDGFVFSNARNIASSMSMLPAPATSDTGIDWRCGGQGFNLVLNSAQESRCRHSTSYNSSFERTSYVDGVQYMLQGLPRDLDPTEAAILRRSMPPALAESLSYPSDSSYAPCPETSPPNRNFIHSTLLFLLMYIQNWIVWITPYILEFSGELLRFERQHKVAETLMGKTVAGLSVGIQAVRTMSDGPLGQCMSSLLEYTAQGVSGALQEFARNELAKKEFGNKRQRQ